MSKLDDTELWQYYFETNDHIAFAILYKRFEPVALRIAKKVAGRHHFLVNDMVQDVFTHIAKLRHVGQMKNVKHFPSYFKIVALRRCLSFYEKHIKKPSELDVERYRSQSKHPVLPVEELEVAELWSTIEDILARNPKYLSVIQMEWAGFPSDEISSQLDIEYRYVRERGYRAREKLKKPLGNLGYDV